MRKIIIAAAAFIAMPAMAEEPVQLKQFRDSRQWKAIAAPATAWITSR